MTRTHGMTADQFEALATGGGGADAVRALRESRRSRVLLLLRYITSHWPGQPAERDAAVEVLAAAQARSAETVGDLLSDPHAYAWAASTARLLRDGESADCTYLSGLAAAAALSTGLAAELPTVAGAHGVFVPTVGRYPSPPGPVLIRVAPPSVEVAGGSVILLRYLAAGTSPRLVVRLDDLDPYRGRYHVPPTGRLTDDDVYEWSERLDAAWALLVNHCPDRAGELAAGLRALVPLVKGGPGVASSATSLDAFGVMGLTLADSPAELAVTLVHEFQHSKLGAMTDVVRLCEPGHTGTYFAPWRADPRPAGGLVQGVYAFLGVAETWQRLSNEPSIADHALRSLAETRLQVAAGLASLERSGALTGEGTRFAAGMRGTLRRLQDARVPEEFAAAAVAELDRIRADWQYRNGMPA